MLKRQKNPADTGMKRLLTLLPIVVLLASCSLSKVNQPTKVPVLHPTVQGLYESCPLSKGAECLTHLEQMAASGFTLVLNYDQLYGTAEQQLAYAKKAASLGMKVIWGMSDPALWNGTYLPTYYEDLATTCQCSDNKGFIQYVVNLVKDLPGTWGYYIGDEVKSSDHGRLKAFADLVRQVDPVHPRLFISGEDSTTMGKDLRPFADSAEVIGSDMYPIGSSYSLTVVGSIAHAVQSIADQYNKPSVIVLQSFNWSEYSDASWVCTPFPFCTHFPTRSEMQQMRDLVIKNAHPRILLWYSYFDIFRSDAPSRHWRDLVDAVSAPVASSHL